MKIELILTQEGTIQRAALSKLLINDDICPAKSVDIHVENGDEYLLIKVPLHRVIVRSELSEPSNSLDKEG